MALRCCCQAARRDNDGSAMLFPQHQGSNDAVRDRRAGSNGGQRCDSRRPYGATAFAAPAVIPGWVDTAVASGVKLTSRAEEKAEEKLCPMASRSTVPAPSNG